MIYPTPFPDVVWICWIPLPDMVLDSSSGVRSLFCCAVGMRSMSKERGSPSAAESISDSISGWADLEPRLWQCTHWFEQMEQECIGGSEHGLGKLGGLSGKVKARSPLKQDSSVALFVLVCGAGKYFLKVGGHGRDLHYVSPWICWRTWELRFIQLPEQASMLHSPITCHSPHSVMACLFLQHQSLPACHSPPLTVGILGCYPIWFWTLLVHFLLSVALCLHIAATK